MSDTSALPLFENVLLIDFDGTLFDTQLLKLALTQQLKTYTQDTHILWETEKKLRDKQLHLVETISEFCTKVGITETKVQDEIQNLFLTQNFPQFVYPEVFEALAALSRKTTLCIFSQGDELFQQVKIHQSGLAAYFQYFFIFQKKLPELPKIQQRFEGKNLWFVDNKQDFLIEAVKLAPSLKTVHIVREQYEIDNTFQPVYRVENFTQLASILEKNS